jgi:hypothetical protein
MYILQTSTILRKSKESTRAVSTPHARVVRPPPSPDSAKTGSSTRHTTQTRKKCISNVHFPSASPETHPNSTKQQQQRGKQNTHPLETPVPTTAPPTKNQAISYILNKTYQPETRPLLCAEFRLQPYEIGRRPVTRAYKSNICSYIDRHATQQNCQQHAV